MREVAVIGVGMTPWGKFPEKRFQDLGVEAITKALEDAGFILKDTPYAEVTLFHLAALFADEKKKANR